MKKGRVKDKDKFCKIKLQEDRRFLGYIDCQQASRIQRHKDACRFGCEFWSISTFFFYLFSYSISFTIFDINVLHF